MPVSFGLADFTTGTLYPDLPVIPGCDWATILGKTDSLTAKVDIRDPDVKSLDLLSITEPKKTVLFAEVTGRTGRPFLALGLVGERGLEEDDHTFVISATGLRYYFEQRLIAWPSAATAVMTNADGSANTALDMVFNNYDLGSIGTGLMRIALTWPGATGIPFVLPAARAGSNYRYYSFLDLNYIGDELDNLSGVIGGPDFAFEGRRVADTSTSQIEYPVRAGTSNDPLIGHYVGSWPYGGPTSPVVSFPFTDDGAAIATGSWGTAGRSDSKVLAARSFNEEMIDQGYPPFDVVDTSHTDVSEVSTLQGYTDENALRGLTFDRSFTLKVRGDTRISEAGVVDPDAPAIGPMLGDYRPGDYVAVDIVDHPLFDDQIVDLRILSISGDETGDIISLDVMVVK